MDALNLSALYQIISPYFSKSTSRKELQEQIKKYIMPKLSIFRGPNGSKTIYYILENEYVETEWKDMISMHYVNTSYRLKNTVMRIHIFSKKEFDSKHYLGFFTLRPIDEVKIMVSFIYPNWNNIRPDLNFDTYIMTYKKKVHILGKEFNIQTYPVFCQDSAVASCAHASLISMSKYLYVKTGIAKLRLSDINNSYIFERSKMYPTSGLGFQQILEIISKNNWHVTYDEIIPDLQLDDEEKDQYYSSVKENIDVNIESALPVFLAGSFQDRRGEKINHVLQIVGHTTEAEKRYVIYDDSGVFINETEGSRKFFTLLSWSDIKRELFEDEAYVIYPQYEKVYMGHSELKECLEPIILRHNDLNKEDADKVKSIYERVKLNIEDSRYLLVDNVLVKTFLAQNIPDSKQIGGILKQNLSHYLWYCEFKIGEIYFVFLADSTYNRQTTRNIFINQEALVLSKPISLLSSYRQIPNYQTIYIPH